MLFAGLNFIHGTTLGLELVKEFQVETQSLVDYTRLIALDSESTFTQVHTELCKIDLEIDYITASLASVQSAEVENKQFIQDLDGKQRETT